MNTWEEITEILSTRLTKQSFDNWFKSTKLFR